MLSAADILGLGHSISSFGQTLALLITFLGIGVQPPAPTWGGILSSDLSYLSQAPWAPIAPALFIAITVGALNTLADAIRDRTNAVSPIPGELGINETTRKDRDDDQQSAA